MKVAKQNILFTARRLVGSWKPFLKYVLCCVSRILPGRTWQLTTNVTWGRQVCSCRPRPLTSYTVCRQLNSIQRTRRLAEVRWLTDDDSGIKMTWSCRRQCVTMCAAWVGQTDVGIYDVTIARHQTLCSYTQCHPLGLPGIHQSINQSSKTNIYSTLCRKQTETTHHQRNACHDSNHRLIIAYRNSKISYAIILVSHLWFSVPFNDPNADCFKCMPLCDIE